MTGATLKRRVLGKVVRQFGRPRGIAGRDGRTLLRPAGRIALVSQPRCPGATRATTARAAHDLQDLLTQAGFTQIRAETLDLDPPVAGVLADSPAGGPS